MDRIKTLPLNAYRPAHEGRTQLPRGWSRARDAMLVKRRKVAVEADEALCEHCAMEGKKYRYQEVECHHKIPRSIRPDLVFDRSNLQFLCKAHHSIRTKHEMVDLIPGRWVITGKPGAGKTTYVAQHAGPHDLVWDADAIANDKGMGSYPRSREDSQKLKDLRDHFIWRAMKSNQPVWMILRWPTTAYAIAGKIRAKVVELVR